MGAFHLTRATRHFRENLENISLLQLGNFSELVEPAVALPLTSNANYFQKWVQYSIWARWRVDRPTSCPFSPTRLTFPSQQLLLRAYWISRLNVAIETISASTETASNQSNYRLHPSESQPIRNLHVDLGKFWKLMGKRGNGGVGVAAAIMSSCLTILRKPCLSIRSMFLRSGAAQVAPPLGANASWSWPSQHQPTQDNQPETRRLEKIQEGNWTVESSHNDGIHRRDYHFFQWNFSTGFVTLYFGQEMALLTLISPKWGTIVINKASTEFLETALTSADYYAN